MSFFAKKRLTFIITYAIINEIRVLIKEVRPFTNALVLGYVSN